MYLLQVIFIIQFDYRSGKILNYKQKIVSKIT